MRMAFLAAVAGTCMTVHAATVRVNVIDASTGRPIEGAYTAVVAEDAPWYQPTRESTGNPTHDVPAGRYRVVAVARGFTTEYERPFTLDATATRDVTLTLKPLTTFTGKVVGPNGAPIAGARVGLAAQFTWDHAAKLSPLAQDTLHANAFTTSGADGTFTLPAIPDGRMVIVGEADGYAPVVLDDAHAGDAGTLALQHGATLVVRWNGTPGATYDRISLLPRNAPAVIPRERAIALWTRPLTAGAATWKSVAAGTYDVVLRGRPRAPHDITPAAVANVTLRAGEQKSVDIALPAALSLPQAVRAPLRLLARDVKLEALSASRVTYWSDAAAERVDAELAVASGGTLLTLARHCAPGQVTIETADAIGVATIRDCNAPASFALRRKAAITATFTAPPGAKLPAHGIARTAKCDLTIPYAIANGRATITVPTDCGDATLAMSTFAPVTVPARTHDAGAVQLREGGAVLARVLAIDGTPLAGVSVKAHREADVEQLRGTAAADSLATLAGGMTDTQGWTRLYGLPAEEIVFSLRGPKRARAHLTDAYAIRTGEELIVDDLTLSPPAAIDVTLQLNDDVEESLFIHSVEVVAAEGNRWPERVPIAAVAHGARSTRIEDVPPGAWNLRALGRLTGGTLAILGERRIDVAPGIDQNVTIEVTDRVYRGRVMRGSSPVRGTLELQPAERGSNRRTATAALNDDGTFAVLLERAGDYIASVQETNAKRGARVGRAVRFEDPADEVIIELPNGRITGRVVRGDGTPVAGASVSALRAEESATRGDMSGAQSTEDGSFALESISAGRWALRAAANGVAGDDVVIDASDGETSGVTLIVAPTRRASIRVLEAAGNPAREAFVVVEPPPADPAAPASAIIRRTNGEGAVELTIPQHLETNPMNVYVLTQDQRLSCATIRLDADRVIRLPAANGEVRLRRDAWAPPPGVALRLVASDGCSVPLAGARTERQEMILPRLAAGTWHFVELTTPQQRVFAFTGRASLLQPLATFTVEPGKSAVVTIEN